MTTDRGRTRRHVLRAAVGGAAAIGAAALAAPTSVLGADNEPLILGADNEASKATTLDRPGITTAEAATFVVKTTISAAVVGYSTSSGQGVIGRSASSAGVQGYSETDAGVNGFGLYGVWATGTQSGVEGHSEGGNGLYGHSTTGTGVLAESAKPGDVYTGYALRAKGRVRFDQCAGVATIAAGTDNVVVTPGVDLVSTSAVVATLQGSAGGSTTVRSVVVNTSLNRFRIYLTANATVTVKVAWHVFG